MINIASKQAPVIDVRESMDQCNIVFKKAMYLKASICLTRLSPLFILYKRVHWEFLMCFSNRSMLLWAVKDVWLCSVILMVASSRWGYVFSPHRLPLAVSQLPHNCSFLAVHLFVPQWLHVCLGFQVICLYYTYFQFLLVLLSLLLYSLSKTKARLLWVNIIPSKQFIQYTRKHS